MDVGREIITAATSLRKLSLATVGYVQSSGMAQWREFQAHQVIKHLTVVSKLGGFNDQPNQPRGEASKILLFCFFLSQKVE